MVFNPESKLERSDLFLSFFSTLNKHDSSCLSHFEDTRRGPQLSCQENRCAESETGEEEILKALEHHQTGEASTHEQAERALRSFQASLNDSLSVWRTTAVPHRIFLSARTRVSGIWFSLICSFYCQWLIVPVLSYPRCLGVPVSSPLKPFEYGTQKTDSDVCVGVGVGVGGCVCVGRWRLGGWQFLLLAACVLPPCGETRWILLVIGMPVSAPPSSSWYSWGVSVLLLYGGWRSPTKASVFCTSSSREILCPPPTVRSVTALPGPAPQVTSGPLQISRMGRHGPLWSTGPLSSSSHSVRCHSLWLVSIEPGRAPVSTSLVLSCCGRRKRPVKAQQRR